MSPEFREWVERAKATTVEAVLQERGIRLVGRGAQLSGPCPICGGEDRFAVHLTKQQFNCRGCGGKGGGAISLVQFLDGGSSFVDAVEAITGEPPPKDGEKKEPRRKGKPPLGKLVATYDYTDELEDLIYQVLRYDPKTFRQRRPDPDRPGEFITNIHGVRLVPYRLADLIEAISLGRTVYIVEGEKDADTGHRLGIMATTTAMGAGKWHLGNYGQFFSGADVIIIPDNDKDPKKGRAHAARVAKDLYGTAASVRTLILPDGYKDLTAWVEGGGTREDLDRLSVAAPRYVNGHDPGAAQFEAPPVGDQVHVRRATLTEIAAFVRGFVPPNYLIDSVLQRGFLYALTGQTGHAKTAVALLMAELIASQDRNAMLGRYRCAKGRVVYFVGENPDDVRMRLIGSHHKRREINPDEDPLTDALFFVPGQFSIPDMRAYLAEQFAGLGGVDLIIVDTSAAYFLGREENDNVAMGAHARMLRTLTELPGHPAVLALCHPVKHVETADQLLPRGGGAFLAEIDGNLTLFRATEETVELSHGKMRGPGFQPVTFQLDTIFSPRLVDTSGRALPTVRARVLTQAQEEEQTMGSTHERDEVLVAMNKYPDHSHAQWAEDIGWFMGGHDGEASSMPYKSKVMRIVKFIEENARPALIRRNMKRPFLTEAGMAEAVKAHGRILARAAQDAQSRLL